MYESTPCSSTTSTRSTTGSPIYPLPTQYNGYTVQQGNNYGGWGYTTVTRTMVTIPLGERTITIPNETLEETKANLTETNQCEQECNIIVATACLQPALSAILDFEEAHKSYFSTGDDTTLLSIIQHSLEQLQQAYCQQTNTAAHPLKLLVSNEKTEVTRCRELFEHCINIIQKFIPCLKGRGGFRTHELFAQTLGWSGWMQQAKEIESCNWLLDNLLDEFQEKDPENKRYKAIRCFQESVGYILDCYNENQYPEAKKVAQIYKKNEIKNCIRYSKFVQKELQLTQEEIRAIKEEKNRTLLLEIK